MSLEMLIIKYGKNAKLVDVIRSEFGNRKVKFLEVIK